MTRRPVWTSETHPLRIDAVAAPGGGGIGMTFCPGKHQSDGMTANWRRDLALDLDRIRDWGAVAVVTLMEQHELDRYGVAGIGAAVTARGMAWLHLPIVDVDIPRTPFEAGWVAAGPRLHGWLRQGRRGPLPFKGGAGRTRTNAAPVLIGLGGGPGGGG